MDAIEAALTAFCCGDKPNGKCQKRDDDDVCGSGYWGPDMRRAIAAWCEARASELTGSQMTYKAQSLANAYREEAASLRAPEEK